MVRNLSGHIPIVDLIRDGIFHLKSAIAEDATSQKTNTLKELFTLAHSALVNFCTENNTNQILLQQYLKLFLANLDVDLGQITLICEICKDNKNIVENSGEMITNFLIDSIIKHGRKSQFLAPIFVNLVIFL
jgi:RIH domain.